MGTAHTIEPIPAVAVSVNVKPVSRTTLSEQVAVQIADMISSGRWKPGQKLPSEAELCKAFGISRPSVREALKSLAFAGLVEMRTGQGSYVADGPTKFLDRLCAHGLLNSQESVADLTTARLALESELVVLCAQRATDEELDKVSALVERIHSCGSDEEFHALDLEFHFTIALYSRSRILSQLLRAVRNLLQELIEKSAELPGDRQLTYEQHLKIVTALKDRNARAARRAMRTHVKAFQRAYGLLSQTRDDNAHSG